MFSKPESVSIELKTETKSWRMSIPLWEGSRAVDVCPMRRIRDLPIVRVGCQWFQFFLDAMSGKPKKLSCGGASVDVPNLLDKMPTSKIGLHYRCTIYAIQIPKLLRKSSYSVMGRIDMFVSMKMFLFPLVGCLDCTWMQNTQYLRKVCQFAV